MGTPDFAVPSLDLLFHSEFKPICVVTQPDRPKGRKKKMTPPDVKVKALALGLEVHQPEDINDPDFLQQLEAMNPDLIVTVAYGGYLKKAIRTMPTFGCINLHPSLLPKYRGAAPMMFPFFSNDQETGCSIFKIVAKMDAGPIYLQTKTKIEPTECYTDLYKRLSFSGAEDLLEAIKLIVHDRVIPQKQNHELATFCHKIEKEHTWIKWDNTSDAIRNQCRAFAEIPGAVASFRGQRIKIIQVEKTAISTSKTAGTIIDIQKNVGLFVATKDGVLLLKRVQPAGKKIMTSHAFNLGARIEVGEQFENGF